MAKVKQMVPSVISSEFVLEGDFYGEGAVDISCEVNGEVRCISLIIRQEAVVNGDVTAEKLEIYGEVNGNIRAKNIICHSTAKVVGDILHQKIEIENGAYIDGNCKKFVLEEAV